MSYDVLCILMLCMLCSPYLPKQMHSESENELWRRSEKSRIAFRGNWSETGEFSVVQSILRGWPWWWADRPIGLIFPWTWLGSWRFGRGNAEACWGASRAMQEAMPARACQPVSAGAKEEGAGSTPQPRKGSKYQRSQARPGRSWKIQESCPAGLNRKHCFPQNRWPLIHLSL